MAVVETAAVEAACGGDSSGTVATAHRGPRAKLPINAMPTPYHGLRRVPRNPRAHVFNAATTLIEG